MHSEVAVMQDCPKQHKNSIVVLLGNKPPGTYFNSCVLFIVMLIPKRSCGIFLLKDIRSSFL